jgi:hypothetical protein
MKALAAILCLSCVTNYAHAACDKNADKLLKAYPEHLVACENNTIVWKSGERQTKNL